MAPRPRIPRRCHRFAPNRPQKLWPTRCIFLKLSFAERLRRPVSFWQKRYYDRNVRDAAEFDEKLGYIHLNPVKRGWVKEPAEWEWSSFRHYALREVGMIEIEPEWTAHSLPADPRECFSAQVSAKVRREPGAPGKSHLAAIDCRSFYAICVHFVTLVMS